MTETNNYHAAAHAAFTLVGEETNEEKCCDDNTHSIVPILDQYDRCRRGEEPSNCCPDRKPPPPQQVPFTLFPHKPYSSHCPPFLSLPSLEDDVIVGNNNNVAPAASGASKRLGRRPGRTLAYSPMELDSENMIREVSGYISPPSHSGQRPAGPTTKEGVTSNLTTAIAASQDQNVLDINENLPKETLRRRREQQGECGVEDMGPQRVDPVLFSPDHDDAPGAYNRAKKRRARFSSSSSSEQQQHDGSSLPFFPSDLPDEEDRSRLSAATGAATGAAQKCATYRLIGVPLISPRPFKKRGKNIDSLLHCSTTFQGITSTLQI